MYQINAVPPMLAPAVTVLLHTIAFIHSDHCMLAPPFTAISTSLTTRMASIAEQAAGHRIAVQILQAADYTAAATELGLFLLSSKLNTDATYLRLRSMICGCNTWVDAMLVRPGAQVAVCLALLCCTNWSTNLLEERWVVLLQMPPHT